MATDSLTSGFAVPDRKIHELKQLLWGAEIRDDVFQRWNQGNAAMSMMQPILCSLILNFEDFVSVNFMCTVSILGTT